jgi:hypothetical protein
MTQEQAQALVINVMKTCCKAGWIFQRVWFDNRNDPDDESRYCGLAETLSAKPGRKKYCQRSWLTSRA